jgi:phosphomannomutase
LHEKKDLPGMVAKTVATSNFANQLADDFGEKVFESKVGFKEFKPVIGKALVYFEESDGISVIGHTPEKDAYIGLLLGLDMVMTLRKNLGEYLLEIQQEHGFYYPAKDGVVVSNRGKELLAKLALLEKYSAGKVIRVGKEERLIVKIIDIDGRKMVLDDGSWLMIRPSGTEPKVRFYVEARDRGKQVALFDAARGMLAEIGLL